MKGLTQGDKIGMISTARKIEFKELSKAIKLLESWGYVIVLGSNLFEEDDQFSGTINQRTSDLQSMLDNDEIKAVLCVRGGYGTVQIIDRIDFSKFIKYPKWIIGYSDITVLHSHLNNLGVSTLHATMPINFGSNSNDSLISLKNSLKGEANKIECNSHKLNRTGKVDAEIVGGNLSVLYSLLGSNSDVITKDRILFIEDLDEYLYHIDRMMINFKRNGKLTNLKALVVGGMNNMNDNEIRFGKSAEEIIFNHVAEYDYPICFGFPSGHIKDNRAIKLGVNSILDISKNGVSLLQ